ncbi:MAG: D-2-hydroxyacid dehydrogenase [Lachnospiraceae bacterium]|nr:D-2-hydroxyacid dehydrogenase [Lachnospiraceae bacterium]
MKIVILDGKTISDGRVDLSVFEEFGELVIYPLTSPDEVVERIKDADIILLNKVELNESNLKYAESLKFIGLFATGYNNIDTVYCAKRGIVVANAGSYSTEAVAQHTFALILNHFNSISRYEGYVAEGGWIRSDTFSAFSYPMYELMGKTIGIIGAGAIGGEVARIAEAFRMNVITYTRKNTKEDLDNLLATSDIITVHCPLNEQSKEMFNKNTFAKCKDGAFFVNTSRGGVVVEEDLAEALNTGKLSGAAIDVLTSEPMRADCKLYGAKNITFTPHVAWAPIETRKRLIGIVAENIRSFLNGSPQNKVN